MLLFETYIGYLRTEMMRCGGWLAHLYHFQPSELDTMTSDTMKDWMDQSEYMSKKLKQHSK
jgi:hypothetical protein